MELLIISENKIKISLTKSDLDSYSISCENIDYDNTETRRVFWTLLDDVKQKTGFDAAKSRIFVQIYPARDGGCELYVSKLGRSVKEIGSSGDSSAVLLPDTRGREYYSFKTIEGVLAVCKSLHSQGYKGASAAYEDENGGFFLCAEGVPESLEFLSEFGSRHTSETVGLYIKEHCREICAGAAVDTLGTLC